MTFRAREEGAQGQAVVPCAYSSVVDGAVCLPCCVSPEPPCKLSTGVWGRNRGRRAGQHTKEPDGLPHQPAADCLPARQAARLGFYQQRRCEGPSGQGTAAGSSEDMRTEQRQPGRAHAPHYCRPAAHHGAEVRRAAGPSRLLPTTQRLPSCAQTPGCAPELLKQLAGFHPSM